MVTTAKTKVRMLAAVSGLAMPGYDIGTPFAHSPDDTPELHPDLAKAWVACGHAELIEQEPTSPAKIEKKTK